MPPTPEQPHLNGAYYGPPIPAKTKAYHRPGRGSNCNPLTCCFSCICGCIYNCICSCVSAILISIAVVLAIAGVILWFIFRPNVPKFHVTDAALTRFTLSDSNGTLYYNLAVNMTFRNPNRRLGIYYDKIETNALYHGRRFATAEVQAFYLGQKTEKDVTAVFKGEQVVVLGGDDKSKYYSEKSDEIYNIDLKLKLRIRFKFWWAKTPKFKPKLECNLKVPLLSKGKVSSAKFERTKCDFDW